MRAYKLIYSKSNANYNLTVPRTIAEQIPKGITFYVELTEDGILYRPSSEVVLNTPKWLEELKNAHRTSN